MPLMNSTGMNTATSEKVMERMVNPISRAALMAASMRDLAHLHVADDVLQHHDGVIHHEAHGKRERHEREVVQAVAQQVHHGERADDGERHGAAGNQGGGEVAQEEEDHQDDDGDGEEQGELHVVDGAANGLRRIESDGEIDGRRNFLAELGQQLFDVVHHLHGIGAGLALDGEDDGALVVVPGDDFVVIDAIDDVGELLRGGPAVPLRQATMMGR